jgi:5'-phosphate synthase pdxT subunit
MKVGIIALQGAVSEHVDAVNKAMKELNLAGKGLPVRSKQALEEVDALIIPGGESTTISKLLQKTGMFEIIQDKVERGMPIMGTCTGCILLAKEGDLEVEKTQTKLLSLMDMKVERNAFGRQKESFETMLDITEFEAPYNAVFIRSPAIEKVWGKCSIMAKAENKIVMARQDNMLAVAFHPELTDDMRVHRLLLKMIL